MWITPDTNQEVSRYLRSAEEYAEEGRDTIPAGQRLCPQGKTN